MPAKKWFAFYRGSPGPHGGRYTRQQLHRWADAIRQFHSSGHDVYAYFNSDNAGYAVTNVRELMQMLDVQPLTAPSVAPAL